MDSGGDVDNVVREDLRKLRGDAQPSPYRVLSVAPGRRVWRARRRRIVMNEAASAPVVSATSVHGPEWSGVLGVEFGVINYWL